MVRWPTVTAARANIRWLAPAAAPALLAAAGCGGNEQAATHPESHAARSIATLWWVMFAGSVVVVAVVLLLLLAALVVRRGAAPSRLGSGRALVAIGGAGVPALALIVLFALTLATIPETAPAGARAADMTIDVTARQWFWDVVYPNEGIRDANEIHLPVGQTVNVRLQSGDVVHSLWVPELNRKMDVIPGRTNVVTFRAEHPGRYRGQCAEFCGIQHAKMALWVVAQRPADYDAVGHRRTASRRCRSSPARLEQRRASASSSSACVYCHTIAGTNATGKVGPDLTHIASRLTLAAGTIPNSRGYLAGWILDPQHLKPGNKMPGTDLPRRRSCRRSSTTSRACADDRRCERRAAARIVGRAGRRSSTALATVDHKRIGVRYLRDRVRSSSSPAGIEALRHARPARRARTSDVLVARGLQPALLDARHHDDLPLRHADAVRLRQLLRAAA